jgi:serine/threonine-protein kinase
MPNYRYEPGKVVEEKFEIIKLLGEGAYSEVYQARDLLMDEICVLKIMLPKNEDEDVLARLKNEVAILKNLPTHPHIAHFLDASKLNGDLYLKLEYVEGSTYSTLLKKYKDRTPAPFTLDETRQASLDLLDALIFLHERPKPILHRDLNPNNLIQNPDRGLVIIDFNVSKIIVQGENSSSIVGTPPFIPPEILTRPGEGAWTTQGDLYAVGVVMYNLLTGRKDPFDSPGDRLDGKPPRKPSVFYPELPNGVEKIILKAIEYDPNKRYSTAKEMRDAIVAEWSPERASSRMTTNPKTDRIDTNQLQEEITKSLGDGRLEEAENLLEDLRKLAEVSAEFKTVVKKMEGEVAKKRQAEVDRLLHEAQALLGDEQKFDEGRIGAMLDQVIEMDPKNPTAPRLREEVANKGMMRRERQVYEETLAKCQALWGRERELMEANTPPDQIIGKIYKQAMDLVAKASSELPDSLLLIGLASEADRRYRDATEIYEAKTTADTREEYEQFLNQLNKLNQEKGSNYLVPWVDERGIQQAPKTVTEAIFETEVIAAEFARNKAREYLDVAKKFIEEHKPYAAHEALEKRNSLFKLPIESKNILQKYDEEQITPELKKLKTAEKLLQKAKLLDDPLVGWQAVNQAIETYEWVSGVDETRRTLAERIMSRAEGYLADGEIFLEKIRTEISEAEIKRNWQAVREKFELAKEQIEKVRQFVSEVGLEAMQTRSASLLKKSQELLAICDREGELIRVMDDAAVKLQKLLDSNELKGAAREWEDLKGIYGEPTLERFSRLRALRNRIEGAKHFSTILRRLEESAFRIHSDPTQVRSALEECKTLIENTEYKKYEEELQVLQEKLKGHLNYLSGLEALEKRGDAAEALGYFELVTRLKEHPDREEALKKVKEIGESKKEEALIAKTLEDARAVLNSNPRRAYELLAGYVSQTSLRKKEITELLESARNLWEKQVTGQLETALKQKTPDLKRLRDLADELEKLPQPPTLPYALINRAKAEASVMEARSYEQQGKWEAAVKAWDQAIQLDGFNHPEYERERRDARLRQVEMGLDMSKGENEARAWLDSLKTEFPNAPQTWEMEAKFYYRIASKPEARASERVRQYTSARQAINIGRDGLAHVKDHAQALVVGGRLDDLENRILAEESLARSMSQVEDLLDPARSQESFKEAVRKVKELQKQFQKNPILDDWWRETRIRIISALEQDDDGLTDQNLWERFDKRGKMLILDPGHARGQELLRNLTSLAMNLDTEITRAVEDRMGLTSQGPDHLALDIQENDLISLRDRGQAAYDMLGQRSQGADKVTSNLRATLANNLGTLQGFLGQLNTLRQWKTQALHHLNQARVDDNWTNFDRLLSEINRAGFGEHRTIRDLKTRRDEMENKRNRLLKIRDELLSLAEEPEGRQANTALRRMEIYETDPNEGDPADEFGLKSTLQVRDPFSGRSVGGWFVVKSWLLEQKRQQNELTIWLMECGLSHVVRDLGLHASPTSGDIPRGIAPWSEIEKATRQMLDEGAYEEATRRILCAIEGEKLSRPKDESEDSKELQRSIWANRESALLAWYAAINRLSNSPIKREQVKSNLALRMLEQGGENLRQVETWVEAAKKRKSEIERQKRKWLSAENDLEQALRELREAVSSWNLVGKKQRVRGLRERVHRALFDCRAIAPKHPILTDVESLTIMAD